MSSQQFFSSESGDGLLIYPGYRGHFQAAVRFSGSGGDFHCEVGVFDTSFQDESESAEVSLHTAGRVVLRWQEIAPGRSSGSWISIPRRRSVTLAAMPFRTLAENAVVLLKMSRTAGAGDYSFYDPYLGLIALKFTWKIAASIPSASAASDMLAIAAVRMDRRSGNVEVMQLHHGVATLWVPLEAGAALSSSSEPSSDSMVLPDDSSSSSDPVIPVFPDESSSPSDPVGPVPPDNSSGSNDPVGPPPPDSPSGSNDPIGPTPPDSPSGSNDPIGPTPPDNSSSSGGTAGRMTVDAVIRLDFSDPQSTVITTMTGRFDPSAPNGDGSFPVTMTGREVLLVNGEEISSRPLSVSWLIVPNPTDDRWEVRTGGQLLPELAYRSVVPDPDYDESIETLEYRFPALSLYPDCPQGMIMVLRKTIHGASLEVPIWVQTDSAQIFFTTEEAADHAPEI